MSLLTSNSTPAERNIGCVFSETFVNNERVIKNGGTIIGTPPINFGANFDGTNGYIIYGLAGNEFNSDEISIVCEFYPDFEPTYNANEILYDTPSNAYRIIKLNNGNGNSLLVYCGITIISNVSVATYSPFWNIGARNTIVVSAVSGSNKVWLNGNEISNTSTAWTTVSGTVLYIGAPTSASKFFDGKITKLQIFNSLLTAQDALNFYNNSTYNYQNQTVLDLQMRAKDHDPSATDEVYRTELLVDGDMEAVGVTAWVTSGTATATKETDNPYSGTQWLKLAEDNTGYGRAAITGFTIGDTYRITGYFRGDGTTTAIITDGGGATIASSTSSTDWQYFDKTRTMATANIQFGSNFTSAGYVGFDDISVKEVLLLDGNMEATGVTDWNVFSSATLTKETTNPHGGTQVLRCTYNGVSNPGVRQSIMTIGKVYRVTGYTRSDGTGLPRVGDNGATRWTGTASTDWQYFDIVFTQSGGTSVFFLSNLSVAGYVEFDDVSVELLKPRTLDVSGNGNHGTFGDGSSASTYPTKLQKRGYSGDGGDYFNLGDIATFNNSSSFSVCMLVSQKKILESEFWLSKVIDGSNRILLWSYTNGSFYIYIGNAGTQTGTFTYSDYFSSGSIHSLVITYNGNGSTNSDKLKAYVDGREITLSYGGSGNIPSETADLSGADLILCGGNPYLEGNIYGFSTWSDTLTPLQIADLHLRMIKQVNDI